MPSSTTSRTTTAPTLQGADGDFDVNAIDLPRPGGTYDDELLARHFITGDGRGNENVGLTAVHTIFHAEHDRLVDDIHGIINPLGVGNALFDGFHADGAWTYGERLFQAAKFVAEMEYQHLVFDTFVRRLEPGIQPFVAFNPQIDASISAEFASAVYRLGHSMLTRRSSGLMEWQRHLCSAVHGFPEPDVFQSAFRAGGCTHPLNGGGRRYRAGRQPAGKQ